MITKRNTLLIPRIEPLSSKRYVTGYVTGLTNPNYGNGGNWLQADKAFRAQSMKSNSLLHRLLVLRVQICYHYSYHFILFFVNNLPRKQAYITFVGNNLKDSHHRYVHNCCIRSNISNKLCSNVYLKSISDFTCLSPAVH